MSSRELSDRRKQQRGTTNPSRSSRIAASIESANTNATNKKRAAAWSLWLKHIAKQSISSPFLVDSSRKAKLRLCESFCDSVRHGELGTRQKSPIHSSTIRNLVAQINQTFRENDFKPPFLDRHGKLQYSVEKLLRSYANEDPGSKCQPALPPEFFSKVLENFRSMQSIQCDYGMALCELTCIAALFGMRSVEYTDTNDKKPKTKKIRVDDIKFIFNRVDPPHLHSNADMVSINFPNQKNGVRNQRITRPKSTSSALAGYCPVLLLASLFSRIKSYIYQDPNPPINLCMKDGFHHKITYQEMIKFHKRVAASVGESIIGFPPSRIGTHSMRVTFATCLYIAGFSDAIIKSEGRWKSDAFLRYIRLQATTQTYNITEALTRPQHSQIYL
jgi:hypothetical protein